MTQHNGLPVGGYRPQSTAAVDTVNINKEMEERLLQRIEEIAGPAGHAIDPDRRWLSIARTHFEQGFMALNRAVFKPDRVKLPGD